MGFGNLCKKLFLSFFRKLSASPATHEDPTSQHVPVRRCLPIVLQAQTPIQFNDRPSCEQYFSPTFTVSVNPNVHFFRTIELEIRSTEHFRPLTSPTSEIYSETTRNGIQAGVRGGEKTVNQCSSVTTCQYSGNFVSGSKSLRCVTRTVKLSSNMPGKPETSVAQSTDILFTVRKLSSTKQDLLSTANYNHRSDCYSRVPTLLLKDERENRIYLVQRVYSVHFQTLGLAFSSRSSCKNGNILVYDITESYDAMEGRLKSKDLRPEHLFAVLETDTFENRPDGGRNRTGTTDQMASMYHVSGKGLATVRLATAHVGGPNDTRLFCTTVKVKNSVDPYFPLAVAMCRDDLCSLALHS